jgi:crotonobetainyl-CoA:carnitine CoA-transferase CaiB-like acyl-CoA transferase
VLPFEGLRVADFTAFWAGPIVGHVLAMLGADVIHVESAARPDGMRFQSARPLGEDQWWEWAPLFNGANTGKRGLTLDLQQPRGRELARQLIARCDVMVENYSPRVLDQWGLGYEELRALRPDLILVRMPAFGLTGPWRDRTGYAQTMEQVSGMAWLTGYPDQEPQVPNGPCDPIAGSHATIALLLALEHRRRTGQGMLVEAPMVAGALQIAAEQVIEHSAYGALLQRQGNRGPAAAPQNLYLCSDLDAQGRRDRWVAIAVASDAHWEALRRALGDPPWARDPALGTVAGRRVAHEALDRELAGWCAEHGSDQIVERLASAGVPAAKVMMPHEQDELPPLQARGFFEIVEHPVTGANPHGGYPVRFSAGPRRLHRRPAPRLGEHNREILSGLLGLSDAEIDELERAGVIGTRP